ncbi:MAG: hypothetical protein C0613_09195 [Desulfobulbaceae bacterium]|nr:MAG: hypothetical protein C0613_09195 [Desulfobulbaceae bacterium]
MARLFIASLLSFLLFPYMSPTQAATYFHDDTATFAWQASAPINVTWEGVCTRYPTDDDKQLVNIGFTFNFAGTDYSQLRILSNGALHLGTDLGFHKDYTNEALPITNVGQGPCSASPADRVIAGYWDDLEPSRGGSVTYETMGTAPNRIFVASWINVPHYSHSGSYTFQIILYETSNEIKFQYGAGNTNGTSATIGIEVSDTDYTEYSFNTSSVTNGDAILFFQASPSALLDLRMDEASWNGTAGEVEDSSGNDHHGTAVNGLIPTDITEETGGICMAAALDGMDDYIALPPSFSNLQGSFTISAWIRADNLGGDQRIFVDDQHNSGGFAFSLNDGGNGRLRFFSRNVNPIILDTGVVIQEGQWHFVTAVHDAVNKTRRIYVDANMVASDTYTGSWGVDNGIAAIGGEPDGSSESTARWRFEGAIDEVLVFASPLSSAQIQMGYANQAAGFNWDGSARSCLPPESGSCAAIFPSALQNSTAAGTIEFGWNAQVSDPDNILETANTIDFNPWGADTCGSSDCTASGFPAAQPEMPSFQHSSGNTDISLGWQEDYTLGSGGVSDYRDITGGGHGTISDGGAQQVYRIRTLRLNWRDELVLRGGVDYWIENLEFNSSRNVIEVVGSGTARLFIGNDVEFSWHADVNKDGAPEDLLIVGYDNLTFNNGNSGTLNALIYTTGDVTTNNLNATGTIAAGGDILWLGELAYDASAVENVDHRGFCGGPSTPLDHIRLEHDGTGITCMAERVTILACADADCTVTYTGEVTVDLTSPVSGWSPDPVTFDGGSTTVDLHHTTAETITLAAVATSPIADNDTICLNNGGGAACQLFFSEVGVLIDGNDNDADAASPFTTQIAGKPSNVAPPSPALLQRIRVVRTDDQTGACIAGVSNETLDATFQYLVPIADQGLADNTITIAGNTSADLSSAGNGATVELAFDGNGTAPFNSTWTDAGRYSLRIDLDIPVTDAAGVPTGDTIPATDTSNDFVVRPLALFADAAGNPKAQDADGGVFKKAGEAFSLTFTSLRWTAGRDSDSDGVWDDCGSSTLTDPGLPLARVPAWNIGQPAAALVLPAAANDPGLSYASGDVTFAAADASVTVNDSAYPEVGIVQLNENVSGGFLGEPMELCSPYIGRFRPDHFVVSINPAPPTFTDACVVGNYSYLGEPFPFATPPIITISAMNGAPTPAITRNYDCGAFWKFATPMNLAYSYTDSSGNSLGLSPTAGTVNPATGDTSDCNGTVQLTLTDTITYARPAILSPLAPFAASVDLAINALQLTDADSVCHDTGSGCQGFSQAGITGTNLRHGRIQIFNNFGPETEDITASPFEAHYYDGTTWSINSDDHCTTGLAFCSAPSAGRVTNIDPDPLAAGRATLTVTTTGTAGEQLDVCLTAPVWLSETDCSAPDLTCGEFTFGIYRGNDRIINWREVVQ